MAKKNKGKSNVTIYPDWCKGCGICVEFCPGKVLAMNDEGKSSVVNEENCIKCGFCELHCPDFAIVVTDKEPSDVELQIPKKKSSAKAGKGA
jgi:2-oxoglutarate ferredoxin oxidoreductase subunit delta